MGASRHASDDHRYSELSHGPGWAFLRSIGMCQARGRQTLRAQGSCNNLGDVDKRKKQTRAHRGCRPSAVHKWDERYATICAAKHATLSRGGITKTSDGATERGALGLVSARTGHLSL